MLQTKRSNLSSPRSGLFAHGYEDPDDPFMFRKKNHLPGKTLSKDAYFQYVKTIAPHIKSNPFLPRIYEVRIEKDPTGDEQPEYTLEKLVHLEDVNLQTLKSVCYSIFGNNEQEIENFITTKQCINLLIDGLETAFYSNESARRTAGSGQISVTNKKLLQALSIIKKVRDTNSLYGLDLHQENMMLRITPVGAQLVLTDPLFQ